MAYLDDQIKLIRLNWFSEHVASMQADGSLMWRRPDSGICAVQYVIHGCHLIVVGDIGQAIYRWSKPVSFKFIAGCHFGYFHEKCEASEDGRRFNSWHGDEAMRRLRAEVDDEDSCLTGLRSRLNEFDGVRAWREEWYRLVAQLHEESDSALAEFDGETLGWVASMGVVPSTRCIGHWLGVRMAMEQLDANESEAA